MINHARTLLLNQPGSMYQPGVLGEEYAPPEYKPVRLPTYLKTAHQIIFGTGPDKVYLNFRAHELLGLIHATELAEFVYALDPRVTYWPQPTTEFFKAAKAATLTKISGFSNSRLYLRGKIAPDNIRGRAWREYFIRVANDGETDNILITAESAALVTNQEVKWLRDTVQPLQVLGGVGGLSVPIDVPDSELQVQIGDVAPPAFYSLLMEQYNTLLINENMSAILLENIVDPLAFSLFTAPRPSLGESDEVLSQWQLQVYSRPGSAINICLPKLELLGEPAFLQLFGVGNTEQPYATFKNIWFDHPVPSYRLAAFTLAMIYRINALRTI